MNYKELLFNKDKVLSFYPELAVILNKYDKILAEEEFNNGKTNKNGKKRRAGTLGLNEAIIINQISYWNEINKKSGNNFKDGYYWTYNTYEKWSKSDFPYWSADTIRKTITALEEIGVIISTDKYNSYKIDNTKWYRVDYDKLQEIINIVEEKETQVTQEEYESCDCVCESYIDGHSNVHKPIPENTTDITNRDYHSENTKEDKTLSNDNVEVKTSSSENRKKMAPPKTNLQKYIDKKADEQDMIKRLANICMTNYDDETAREIFETIEYYFRRYTDKTGLIHPILTDKTLERMAEKMDRFYDSKHSHFERLIKQDHAFMKMVDMFFDSDFGAVNGNETNYNLPAFMTDGILNPLGQRLFELGEVM